MINPLQVLGEIVNALFPPRTPHPCPRCEALFDDEPTDWPRDLHAVPANDHRGYYESTPTCDQEHSAGEHPDDIVHGCYREPGHGSPSRGDDHICLCGHIWSPTTVPAGVSAGPAPTAPSAGLCEHCQQPIKHMAGRWCHTDRQLTQCVGIPGYPRSYAAPQM